MRVFNLISRAATRNDKATASLGIPRSENDVGEGSTKRLQTGGACIR